MALVRLVCQSSFRAITGDDMDGDSGATDGANEMALNRKPLPSEHIRHLESGVLWTKEENEMFVRAQSQHEWKMR